MLGKTAMSLVHRIERILRPARARARGILLEAERLVRESEPVSEDVYFQWRIRRLELVPRLAGLLENASFSGVRVRMALAGLHEQLKQPDRARDLWEQALACADEGDDVYLLLQARVQLLDGKRQEAAETLAKIPAKGKHSADVELLKGRIETTARSSRSRFRKASLEAYKALVRGERERCLAKARLAFKEKSGTRQLPLARLATLVEALFDFVHAPTNLTVNTADVPEPGRIFFCCGLGWTGSGAVFDYLNQFSEFDDIFSRNEVRFIEFNDGAAGVLKAMEQDPSPAAQSVVVMIWGGLLGLAYRNPDGRRVVPPHSLLTAWMESPGLVRRLVDDTVHFLGNASKDIDDPAKMRACLSNWLMTLLRPRPGHSITLVNNAIHGQRLRALSLFENARAVVVLRNPADQFVAREIESPRRSGSGPTWFIKYHGSLMRRFSASLDDFNVSSRVRTVFFEDFVTDQRLRQAVLDYAGATGSERKGDSGYFDARRSEKNIGIARHYADRQAIHEVERGVDMSSLEFLAPLMLDATGQGITVDEHH